MRRRRGGEPGRREASGPPAQKHLPSCAVIATADKAAGTDLVRSMAARAGAKTTEVDGSHVIMISQPQAVTDVILEVVAAVGSVPSSPSARLCSGRAHHVRDHAVGGCSALRVVDL